MGIGCSLVTSVDQNFENDSYGRFPGKWTGIRCWILPIIIFPFEAKLKRISNIVSLFPILTGVFGSGLEKDSELKL